MSKLDAPYINRFFLEKVSKKRPKTWIFDSLLDWVVIAIAISVAVMAGDLFGYILASFVVGNRQHALALLGHDGTHFTIHKSKKLNDFLSDLFAFWPVGLTTSGYRSVHFLHHKHLNTANDPELMHRSSKAPQWDLPINLRKIGLLSFLDLFGYSASDYWMIIKSAKPEKIRTWAQMFFFHATFITIFMSLSLPQVLVVWYASLLTTFMMFFRIRTWLEHQGSEETHRMKLNRIEEAIFSPHRSWYHYEHHNFPSVPYSRLHLVRDKFKGAPVMTLKELLSFYASSPDISSGSATKKSVNIKPEIETSTQPDEALAA